MAAIQTPQKVHPCSGALQAQEAHNPSKFFHSVSFLPEEVPVHFRGICIKKAAFFPDFLLFRSWSVSPWHASGQRKVLGFPPPESLPEAYGGSPAYTVLTRSSDGLAKWRQRQDRNPDESEVWRSDPAYWTVFPYRQGLQSETRVPCSCGSSWFPRNLLLRQKDLLRHNQLHIFANVQYIGQN